MSEVYKSIAAVQGELAKIGIAKTGRNQQQGYNFRGIDDVYAALAPLLAKHELCVIPRMLDREVTERTTAKGGVLFYVTVKAEFDFVSAKDDSKHTAATYGEAMDSGDKATNKAMSAAYKYAALLTFAIPTEGDNDADATQRDDSLVPRISAEQCATLREMIGKSGATEEAFCDYIKLGTLPEMYADKFEAAKSILTKRIAAQEAKDGATK